MKTAALVALVLSVAVSGARAAVLPLGSPLRVTPKAGHQHSTFRLQYMTPHGSFGGDAISDLITLTGASGVGCVSSESVHAQPAASGSPVLVRLRPTGGHPWCVGTFRGQVEETVRPSCGPAQMCPMFVAEMPVGHFQFVVRR